MSINAMANAAVALVAALPAVDSAVASDPQQWTGRCIAFGLFLLFTPLAIWITFATKLVSDRKEMPVHSRYWPKWEMTAGTLAYVAWAVGLPDSPFSQFPWYSAAVAVFIVLTASTLLGMLAGLFQGPIKATKAIQEEAPAS